MTCGVRSTCRVQCFSPGYCIGSRHVGRWREVERSMKGWGWIAKRASRYMHVNGTAKVFHCDTLDNVLKYSSIAYLYWMINLFNNCWKYIIWNCFHVKFIYSKEVHSFLRQLQISWHIHYNHKRQSTFRDRLSNTDHHTSSLNSL